MAQNFSPEAQSSVTNDLSNRIIIEYEIQKKSIIERYEQKAKDFNVEMFMEVSQGRGHGILNSIKCLLCLFENEIKDLAALESLVTITVGTFVDEKLINENTKMHETLVQIMTELPRLRREMHKATNTLIAEVSHRLAQCQ